MDEKLQGFHVSRLARDRYRIDHTLFTYLGKSFIADFQAARRFATQMNRRRDIGNFPHQMVLPGHLYAIALIQAITHYLFRLYCERHPGVLQQAIDRLKEQIGPELEKTLQRFLDEFPPQPVYQRVTDTGEYLTWKYENRPNREVALEEVVILWLENTNPAYSPFLELFDDDGLKKQTAYNRITAELKAFFDELAKNDPGDRQFPGGVNILDILLEPVRAAPYSLEGQLRYLVERWGGVIGAYIYRLLTASDILKEEWRPAAGPGGPGGKGTTPVPFYERADIETENFTPDRDWMPNLVMLAKNAFVWLDQLSKKYQRQIMRLDEIPDEELDQLAQWGITGLWLIGLWERSTASQRIKQYTGNPDAVASAYSLYDYQIAARLGGEAACQSLRAKAWKRGIRLASDMVPNHVGIDGKWVIEQPDWFLSLDYPPYPNYTFSGGDLSQDERVGIFIEDHYYNRTDAAVVFKRLDRYTGNTRYIYHGNDGTSMPWNDTAQLNYLNPDLREAMVQTILHVARQFPIIRFDAAMTLVKKHIQRLWFPEPGTGSAIPSRAEHGMTREQFDQLMPVEFWREVVDRAAVEAPDTLLLAEAFWLLEGYFVRTLGMHRVYNSAFMNMLRDEENSKYRLVIKNTIEFDTEVLRRYVNFLNNPDEKTAVEQFGKGDKYFGITMMMITMPGLPMFGHGQIEGYGEKYGMEYYRAYMDEQPDMGFIHRHEHEIFPLCRKRYLFAGAENFLLYDFYVNGNVDENVFAYSNRVGDERSLVLYNNAYNTTAGWIKTSAAYSVKTGGDNRQLVQRTLGEGLGLPADGSLYCIFREHRAGLEYIRNCRELCDNGFFAELSGYQYLVLLDFRIVADTETRRYSELAAYLNGRGVPSIDDTLREILFEPIRAPFRELVNVSMFERVTEARVAMDDELLDDVEQKFVLLAEAIHTFIRETNHKESQEPQPESAASAIASDVDNTVGNDAKPAVASETVTLGRVRVEEAVPSIATDEETPEAEEFLPAERAAEVRGKLEALLQLPDLDTPGTMKPVLDGIEDNAAIWNGLFSWLIVHALGTPEQSRSWIDEWLLGRLISTTLRESGVEDFQAARTLTALKLAVNEPDLFFGNPLERASELLEALLSDPDAQQLLNINYFQGVLWFNQEGFDTLSQWLMLLAQLNSAPEVLKRRYVVLEQLQKSAERSGYQIEYLRSNVRAMERSRSR